MNLGTYLDAAVQQYTDHPYLQFYDRTITYGDFGRQVNILANALKRQGFEKGDFIHVLVQNSPQTLMAYFAIQKIGAFAIDSIRLQINWSIRQRFFFLKNILFELRHLKLTFNQSMV